MRIAGLGSVPAAGWRPTRGWEVSRFTVGQRVPVTAPAIRAVVDDAQRRTARALFTPAFAVETCGQPGGLPCSAATPQSALKGLSGLGDLGAAWDYNPLCSSFAYEMNRLGPLLAEADRIGLTGTVVDQARARLDVESSSLMAWRRSDPVLPSTCAKVTNEVLALNNALAAAIKQRGGDPGIAAPPGQPYDPNAPSDTASTIKTVAIAAAIIAGVMVVAPMVWEGVAWAKVARSKKR